MNTQELQNRMERYDVFDNELLSHGYKDYMRDYELIIENRMNSEPLGTYSYLFKYCVEAHIATSLSDEGYRMSMVEALEQLARSKGRHRLCKIERYECVFDRSERALGASGG